jgi:hypothetical protein
MLLLISGFPGSWFSGFVVFRVRGFPVPVAKSVADHDGGTGAAGAAGRARTAPDAQ